MANHNDHNGWVDERLRSLDGPRTAQANAGQARARLRERQDATCEQRAGAYGCSLSLAWCFLRSCRCLGRVPRLSVC
jgi:hypothetical protein